MVGHTGCSMKLDKSGTSLRCNRCVSTNITGVNSCTSNPTAVVDGEDGQLTASASNTVEGAKIAMGVDCRERKLPQNAPVNDSFKSIILSTPLTFHVF
ncbi:unnamed protein product [Brassica oleracea var. botrytis]